MAGSYHHGDLRRALLDAAGAAIEEHGPGALSLRDLARRAGVSHAAPTHHFGDKAGLLTALAAEGYDLLAADLAAAWEQHQSFLEQGVAYIHFALRHRAHFDVMFRPDLYHRDDPELVAANNRANDALYLSQRGRSDDTTSPANRDLALAGWSIAHGFATLWASGAIADLPENVDDLARRVLAELHRRA